MLEICALNSKDLSHYGLCKCSTVGDWTRAGMDENITVIASSKPGGKKKVIFKSKEFVFNKRLKHSLKYVCRFQAGKVVLFVHSVYEFKTYFIFY
jgi:hypothetical protein